MTLARAISITLTQTATYVAAKLVGSFQEVLAELGISGVHLHDWTNVESALRTWMNEKTLRKATVEVWDPATGSLVTRFDYPVRYDSAGTLGEAFRQDMATTRNAARRAAIGGVPRGARFRVLVETQDWATKIEGWDTTQYRSTSDLVRRGMGEVAAGPHAAVELEFWVRR